MKVNPRFMQNLRLTDASNALVTGKNDHMPRLIIDRCLENAASELTKETAARFISGRFVEAETITMPRRGFGPRPITVASPVDRVLYSALVQYIAPELPAPSRQSDKWKPFSQFGTVASGTASEFVVSLDITACYEYIDHAVLREQLLIQTMNVEATDPIVDYLGELFGRDRGLPQMSEASDVLADTYLSAIERFLMRRGYPVLRFADDFRVLATSWAEANQVIEEAAEEARRYGLVLSSEKTSVIKAATLQRRNDELEEFIAEYFEAAREDLTAWDVIWGSYDESDDVELEPEDDEAYAEACRRILTDFAAEEPEVSSIRAQVIGRVIKGSQRAPDRLADEVISQVAFKQPVRLEALVQYVMTRPETEANWKSLLELVNMERQSPWAKLWLLHAAEQLESTNNSDEEEVLSWARKQLSDRHEIIRAEAAWCLAQRSQISEADIGELYGAAGAISRPALAASAARIGAASKELLVQSMRQDSRLSAKAFDWGLLNDSFASHPAR